ncbi:MAG: hypothetical protein ACUVX8_15300 [Candidatus Zipacnadales bacterium]
MKVVGMFICVLALPFMFATGGSAADLPTLIGLPDQGLTFVEGLRELHEDWGTVNVLLEVSGYLETAPEAAFRDEDPPPFVRLISHCGPCELRTLLFRAPTDPRSTDVICATVANSSSEPVRVRLVIRHSANDADLTLSPAGLSAGARRLISLPASPSPTLPLNEWGLASDAGPLRDWGHPNVPCDPAFRNIRVGWQHQPITYRFRVEPKTGRKVIVGLCESHWQQPGQRPLLLQVEGAPDRRVDPVAEWGQHVPVCLAFDARDINEDGWLTVTSIATADAPDKNSILNAIWLFPASAPVDLEAVKRGERSAVAERYVDVGGQADQSLYATGDISYDLELPAAGKQTLTFLVATGGASAPAGVDSALAADRLVENTSRLWTEWYASGCSLSVPDRTFMRVWRASLAAIPLVRGQVSKYLLPQASLSPDSLSYASIHAISRALDLTGHPREAEASLLLLWDKPLPESIARWGQGEEGLWQVEEGDLSGHCLALSALAQHCLIAGDMRFQNSIYLNVIVPGWHALLRALEKNALTLRECAAASPERWATVNLRSVALLLESRLDRPSPAQMEQIAGLEELTQPTLDTVVRELTTLAQSASCQGFLRGPGSPPAWPDAAEGARFIALLRSLLVDDSDGQLRLLSKVPEEWLLAEGGISVQKLPTNLGPLTFRARLTDPHTLKIALHPLRRDSQVIITLPPSLANRALHIDPVSASKAENGRAIRVPTGEDTVVLTIRAIQ